MTDEPETIPRRHATPGTPARGGADAPARGATPAATGGPGTARPAPSSPTLRLGAHGEELAARFLTQRGLDVLDRNWRCDVGEVDIVARDGTTLVVCEVKTRRHEGFGSPIEAVTPAKLARLRRLAGCWVRAHPRVPGVRGAPRIDVIGILRPAAGPARLTHVRGVA